MGKPRTPDRIFDPRLNFELESMKRIITTVLLIFLFVSCDKRTDFQNDYVSKINLTDKIEVRVINDGQKKSIMFDDKERLEFLKDVLKPKDLISRKLTDDTSFPIDIILYAENKVIGQMGIEFGHIQYIYYKGEENFDFKAVMNDRMKEFIEVINQARNDK